MARARNSGESSNRRMKALVCFNTLAGTISALVAEQEDRHAVVPPALRCQRFLEDLPLLRSRLRAIDRNQPARLDVEHLGQTPRVRVADARDHAKPFLLDSASELAHAAPRGSGSLLIPLHTAGEASPARFPGRPPALAT